MKDTIWLICERHKVETMRKNKPSVGRNQRRVKLNIEMDDSHFEDSPIEKTVYVEPWERDLELEDPHFEDNAITEEEAEKIREDRREKMKEHLEEHGYEVKKKDEQEVDAYEDEV